MVIAVTIHCCNRLFIFPSLTTHASRTSYMAGSIRAPHGWSLRLRLRCALQAQALAEGQQVGEPFLAAPVDEVVLGARRPALGRPEAVAVAVAVQDPAVVGSERTRHLQACVHMHPAP
jgi:hypothetical protein